MDELYIPVGVKKDTYIFKGFGKKEFMQSVVGSLFGGALGTILWICFNNIPITIVTILTMIFASVVMTVKDNNNQSVVDLIGNMISFANTQHIYPYRYLKEWDIY